ncbi:MAG: tail fiber domain-containing protein [Acidobacteria bacterium]|nr:tail fiber domain-containing protein [Acidobacteriota bacterium]
MYGAAASSSGFGVYSDGNAHVQGNLTVSGSVTAVSVVETSSRRFKTNIQPLEGSLDEILRLRGVSYDWKADGKHDIGLIAEEVGEVIPEVVAYEDNGVDAKGVDYARLVAVLIEAVKEQQAQIRQLQSEVEGLKTRIGAEVSQLEPRQ